MEHLSNLADIFLHLDHHLNAVINQYGPWAYLILFLIIFCETGLVVTPFLPGDSLIFAVGALTAHGPLDLWLTWGLLSSAAVLGNVVNYSIGKALAPKIFRHEEIRFIKKEYLERTKIFFEKYGGKTIILTRFLPILRTFAPFLAGVGSMNYLRFFLYNIAGGILWVSLFLGAGYYFGNLEVVRRNFSLVILAIIVISLIPAVVEFLKARKKS